MNATQALSNVFRSAIGYDPNISPNDHNEMSAREALRVLQEWMIEARANGVDVSRFDSAVWQLERMDLAAPDALEGPALECILPAFTALRI